MFNRRNERIQALVIKGTAQGESNKLIVLFRADGRMVHALAHGARKPTSRFGAALEPGTLIQAQLRYGTSQDGLVTLTEGIILNAYQGLKQSLGGMELLFDFLGLLQYVCRCAAGDSEFYQRSLKLLEYADQTEEIQAGILPMLKGIALLHLGRMPDWSCCSRCRTALPERISLDGVYCNACAALDRVESRAIDPLTSSLAERIVRGEIPQTAQAWDRLEEVFDWLLEAVGLRRESKRRYMKDAGN